MILINFVPLILPLICHLSIIFPLPSIHAMFILVLSSSLCHLYSSISYPPPLFMKIINYEWLPHIPLHHSTSNPSPSLHMTLYCTVLNLDQSSLLDPASHPLQSSPSVMLVLPLLFTTSSPPLFLSLLPTPSLISFFNDFLHIFTTLSYFLFLLHSFLRSFCPYTPLQCGATLDPHNPFHRCYRSVHCVSLTTDINPFSFFPPPPPHNYKVYFCLHISHPLIT